MKSNPHEHIGYLFVKSDSKIIEFIDKACESVRSQGEPLVGFFPEYLVSPNAHQLKESFSNQGVLK